MNNFFEEFVSSYTKEEIQRGVDANFDSVVRKELEAENSELLAIVMDSKLFEYCLEFVSEN